MRYRRPASRPERSRPAGPATVVVLAAVGSLVAGAAGATAYVEVSRYLAEQRVTDPGPTSGPTTASSTLAGERCPAYTIAAVKAAGGPGDLTQLLHVEGTHPQLDDAEAWICQDSDGDLYYQGHDKTGAPITAATSAFTILLGSRVQGSVVLDGSTYVATNPGKQAAGPTIYRVSRTEFAVIHPDGSRTTFTITRTSPTN